METYRIAGNIQIVQILKYFEHVQTVWKFDLVKIWTYEIYAQDYEILQSFSRGNFLSTAVKMSL